MTTIPTPARPARPGRGFTLVEILVVVGIIAVLAAILVPALTTARANALWASSQNNLKQLFTYQAAYVASNRDFIPPSRFDYRNNFVKGRVRSPEGQSGTPVNPPLGEAHTGTWADILWSDAGLGGIALQLTSGEEYNYVHDSPDRVLYDAQPDFNRSPFRSSVVMAEPFNEDATSTQEATPFGTGAAMTLEFQHPGYFAANDFFDSTGVSPGSAGAWYTTGQIKRPDAAVWLVDSRAGETVSMDELAWAGHDGEIDHRYVGDMTLLLLLDGHTESVDHFDSLQELQGEYFDPTTPQQAGTDYTGLGYKVTNLDRSDNPNPTP